MTIFSQNSCDHISCACASFCWLVCLAYLRGEVGQDGGGECISDQDKEGIPMSHFKECMIGRNKGGLSEIEQEVRRYLPARGVQPQRNTLPVLAGVRQM
jgi:hypothetical protein